MSEAGLRDVGWNVFQSVHADGPPKLIQTVTMERIAPAVLRLGLLLPDIPTCRRACDLRVAYDLGARSLAVHCRQLRGRVGTPFEWLLSRSGHVGRWEAGRSAETGLDAKDDRQHLRLVVCRDRSL